MLLAVGVVDGLAVLLASLDRALRISGSRDEPVVDAVAQREHQALPLVVEEAVEVLRQQRQRIRPLRVARTRLLAVAVDAAA